MDIFSADPGTVVLADVREGTPMNLFIEGHEPDPSEDPPPPPDDWGGFESLRSIVTGFAVDLEGGVQFTHSLDEFVFVYTFGERMGTMQLSGISFYQDCQEVDEVMTGGEDHGLEEMIGYYGLNRVNTRRTPVLIVLGASTPFECFLVKMRAELIDSEQLVGRWTMDLKTIPG